MTETLAPARFTTGNASRFTGHGGPARGPHRGAEPGTAVTPGTAPAPEGLTTARGAALYIGALLGPGLLLLPGLAVAVAGPASLLAWVALLVLSALFAVVFGAFGLRLPSAGGGFAGAGE